MSVAQTKSLRLAIVVASLGRRDELAHLLGRLAKQTRKPDCIILSLTTEADLPDDANVRVIYGSAGSCIQRNRGLDAVQGEADLVAFIDDDYVPSTRFVEDVVSFFEAHPDVVGANGELLADGVKSGGVSIQQAERLVDAYDASARPAYAEFPIEGLYGCNMVFRVEAVGAVRFDEALPLYGWQEDVDFSARVMEKGGRLLKTNAFAGVHCGVAKARSPGLRLGYSQIANPVYLMRKGTMSAVFGWRLMARNFVANHVRSLAPEPWVDRKGRVKGNWMALNDLRRGELSPAKILELTPQR